MSKRNRITKKALRESARTLLKAMERMNDGGRHWIKGAEKRAVDPETHEPGAMSYYDMDEAPDGWEPAYCSIGALYEEEADGLAFIALAEIVRPRRMAAALKSAEKEAATRCRMGWIDEDEVDGFVQECLVSDAKSLIINFNDTRSRKWRDVRKAFTEAAESLLAKAQS